MSSAPPAIRTLIPHNTHTDTHTDTNTHSIFSTSAAKLEQK